MGRFESRPCILRIGDRRLRDAGGSGPAMGEDHQPEHCEVKAFQGEPHGPGVGPAPEAAPRGAPGPGKNPGVERNPK